MACGARSGLKPRWLTTVALVEGEEETSPPRSLKNPQPLPQMGLQRRCCLLQHRHRQVLRRTQTQVVTVIAQVPMRSPGPVGHPYHLMMGGEASLGANEAKRGLSREPGKPFWTLRGKGKQTLPGTDHHVLTIAAGFDQWDDVRWLFGRRRPGSEGRTRAGSRGCG